MDTDDDSNSDSDSGGLFDFDVKLHRRVSLSSLQIQEEDGEWRYGDLYEFETLPSAKDVAVLRVVIHFGKDEFEGLGNDVYRLHLTDGGGGGFAFNGDPELGRVLDPDGDLVPTRSCDHPQQESYLFQRQDDSDRPPAEHIKDGQRAFRKQTKKGDALLKKACGGKERPLADFFFCVISAGRPGNVIKVESALEGCDVTWIVATGDKQAYAAGGASKVIEGGKLCASRNKGLELARKLKKPCVQLSDDLKKISFVSSKEDRNRADGRVYQSEANRRARAAVIEVVSPGAAAQYIDVQSKATSSKLGGTYPCGNAGQGCSMGIVAAEHFVVGDFFVSQPESTITFDEELTLKEDYDFTCQHIHAFGRVARCNRLDSVWVPTEFHRLSFLRAGVEAHKLVVVGEPVDGAFFDPAKVTAPYYLSPPIGRPFRFLSVFKWEQRKG